MKLVVVRHLPTAWNIETRMQGQQDIPIVVPDAEALALITTARAAVESHGPFDAVYCSRMMRTRQTAELFGYPEPVPDVLLDELHFGPFEGAMRADMLAALGAAWFDAPQTLTLGESILDLGKRVERFLEQIAQHQRVLVFGHGAWTRALYSLRKTGGLEQMNSLSIANGEVLVFEV